MGEVKREKEKVQRKRGREQGSRRGARVRENVQRAENFCL